MRKAFACSLVHCFRAFPDWSLRRFRKLRSAAARGESSTSCSPMPPMSSEIARPSSLGHLRPIAWRREIRGVFCKCNPRWRAGDKRLPWFTRFNCWMPRFAASRLNLSDVDHFYSKGMPVFWAMSRNSSTTGKTSGTPFLRRNSSASRSGSPGKSGPLVPGAGLVARKVRM